MSQCQHPRCRKKARVTIHYDRVSGSNPRALRIVQSTEDRCWRHYLSVENEARRRDYVAITLAVERS